MNDAVFAIPGLMPPKAVNWLSELKAPEDGSLLFLAHAGAATDKVTYTICLPGPRKGVIKDPNYEFAGRADNTPVQLPKGALFEAMDTSQWPNFMEATTTLPEGILVPRKVCCGCPIPINELPHLKDLETVWYWVLELPKRALPVGDTVIEICVNNKIREYVVKRPPYAIHRVDDRTNDYKLYTEDLIAPEDVTTTLKATKQGSVEAILPKLDHVDWSNYVFFATIELNNTSVTVMGHLTGENTQKVAFEVPKLEQTGMANIKISAQRPGNVLEIPLIQLPSVVA